MTDNMVRKIGPWVLGKTLGQGGFGWVKDATHEKTGDKRAMKFMLKGAKWNKNDEEEARNEIEALSKIKHDNVVGFYGFDFNCMYPMKDGEEILTVMFEFELAAGGDLFDIIFFNPGGLREDITRYYFKQLIYSIEACHKNNIVHRDVKPQNLLLDGAWNLKLADFGLAKIFEADKDDRKTNDMLMTTYRGTPGYRAPEIEMGKTYDMTCDVFSCGVALFVLLTGYPPFKQPLPNDYWYQPLTRKKNLADNVRKFWRRHKHDRLTDDVKSLLSGMFAFDVSKRLTVAQIQQHLWFKGETISQEKLVPTLKRMRTVALANYWKDPKRSAMNKKSVKARHGVVRGDGDCPPWMQPQDYGDASAKVRKFVKATSGWSPSAPTLPEDRIPAFTEFGTTANAQRVITSFVEFIDNAKGRFEICGDYHVAGKLQVESNTKGFEMMEVSLTVFHDPATKENTVVLKRLQGGQVNFQKAFRMIMEHLIEFWNVDSEAVQDATKSDDTEVSLDDQKTQLAQKLDVKKTDDSEVPESSVPESSAPQVSV